MKCRTFSTTEARPRRVSRQNIGEMRRKLVRESSRRPAGITDQYWLCITLDNIHQCSRVWAVRWERGSPYYHNSKRAEPQWSRVGQLSFSWKQGIYSWSSNLGLCSSLLESSGRTGVEKAKMLCFLQLWRLNCRSFEGKRHLPDH